MAGRVGKDDLKRLAGSAGIPYIVLVLSLSLTIGATLIFYQSSRAKDQNRFNAAVNRVNLALENRIGLYFALLNSSRGFVETTGTLDRVRFSAFVDNLQLETLYSGSQGIGYSKTVDVAQTGELVAKMRAEFDDSIRVGPLPPSGIVQPIVYIEPMDERNRRAIGFNMESEAHRREAMNRARDTGLAAATARTVLLQEREPDKQFGFLIYVPIYRAGAVHDTVEQRRAALEGFVYSPFRAGNFLSDVQRTAGTGDLVITIFDGPAQPSNFLAQTESPFGESTSAQFDSEFSATSEIEVAGRRWTIKYDSLPTFSSQSSTGWTLLLVVSGAAISLILFALTYWEASARAHLQVLAAELAESETQIQSLFDKEQSARRLAEKANTAKDEFIAVVSHELRTPLNAIAGWTRILKDTQVDPATRLLAFEKVEKNLRLQTSLVDDLLSYSQLVASGDVATPELIDCGALAREIFDDFAAEFRRKRIAFDLAENLNGSRVLGDREKLRLVFSNLLSNALKFTSEDGRVHAEVGCRDGFVTFVVSDDGRGIDPDFLPRIFERFSQFDNSATRCHGGLGLGLAVSEHIVRIHNGTIEAVSDGEGKGATFTVRLPVALNSEQSS